VPHPLWSTTIVQVTMLGSLSLSVREPSPLAPVRALSVIDDPLDDDSAA